MIPFVALLLWGCDDPARDHPIACGFGETHSIALAAGPVFDGLDLVGLKDGARVVYADRSGTFVRHLGARGKPSGAATRIGAPCPGGVAATESADGLLIACARPGDRDRGRPGALTLYRVADEVATLASTSPIGEESRSPDVAEDGGRVVVGWRDADVFTARARVVELEDGAFGEPRALSSEETLASAPSLAFIDGTPHYAWTESWFDRSGRAAGHLLVLREGDPPRPSLSVADVDVSTFLTADATGPMVALRDQRPIGARHRSFVGRLDADLGLSALNLHSPGRADAEGGRPMLVPCGGFVFSVATRRSSREVTMVTLRRLDAELSPAEEEQQIYEYHARFPQAVAACVEDRLLVAVGEHASEVQRVPRLRTYELVCEPGRAHERTPGDEGQVLRKRGADP